MDRMIQGLAYGSELRFFAAYTRDTVQEAARIHGTSPVCSAALGRLLTAAAMMGRMEKNEDDLVTLRIEADGPIGGMTVTADVNGYVKGLINNPQVELPLKENGHLDVGSAVGKGTLSVIRGSANADPYIGQIQLATGEIGEDLTYYYAESEQIPTSVGLGVLVDRDLSIMHAGGFILQLLPFASDATIDALEQSLKEHASVTDFFKEDTDPEVMMRKLLGDIVIEDSCEVAYRCYCNRQRVEKALISLGRDELEKLIAEGEEVKLHCDFCNKDYSFTLDEVKALI
ncbi:MAG: Hsp33 family molecular chaperone HslO [Lachnospiraceae bacterium]|nr:Hsp33 family molecular chaperone HslO [Lachnospiraceae bacterium]